MSKKEIQRKIDGLKEIYGWWDWRYHIYDVLSTEEFLYWMGYDKDEKLVYKKIKNIHNSDASTVLYYLNEFVRGDIKDSITRKVNLKNIKNWKWHRVLLDKLEETLPHNFKQTNEDLYNEILTDCENIYITRFLKGQKANKELISIVGNILNRNSNNI